MTELDLKLDPAVTAALDNVNWASVAADAGAATPNQTLSGDIEAGISGAAEGTVVAAVVGEVAVVVGATIITGDVAAAIGVGVAAGAACGSAYGPIGAAVGAVIGVLVALFGKPGPTAFQTRAFEGTPPIQVFKGVVSQGSPRLCIEIMQDPQAAVALCTWAATDDYSSFNAWLGDFVACKPTNGAVRRLAKLFESYEPTDAEIAALARVPAIIVCARDDAALAPGDDQAVQVLNALADAHFAITVENGYIHEQVHVAIRKLINRGAKARAKAQNARIGKMNVQQELAAGHSHALYSIDGYGHVYGAPEVLTYRQAQIAVKALFNTPIGAEDPVIGALRPLDPLGHYGPPTPNPPPMLAVSGLSIHEGQWQPMMAAIAADTAAHPDLAMVPFADVNTHPALPVIPDFIFHNSGVAMIHGDGSVVNVNRPHLSWFERMLEWIEMHVLHIRPKLYSSTHVDPALSAALSADKARGPMIPRGGGVHGVFGHSFVDDYAQRIDVENPDEEGVNDDGRLRVEMWMSDPVRSTVAIEVDGNRLDETVIGDALDAPDQYPQVIALISALESAPVEGNEIAAIGLRMIRMKRAAETLVARSCAGDKDAERRVSELARGGGVIGRMVNDYLALSEVHPLQERAMRRRVHTAPQAYPIA